MPSITFDEWKSSQATKGMEKAKAKEFHQQATIAVAQKASTVVAHEGWQTFLDHTEAYLGEKNKYKEGLVKALADNMTLSPNDMYKMKLEISHLTGEIKSLDMVINLIPTLIQSGKVAAESGARVKP